MTHNTGKCNKYRKDGSLKKAFKKDESRSERVKAI